MTSIFRGFQPPPPPPEVIIPRSGDDNFRPMVVVEPFVDPSNSFRARTVSDMFFITPERTDFSTLEFDVGLDPQIKPITFSIQNRCLNTTLRVSLRLPQFLRSSLGTEFLVPAIGDTDTAPIRFFNRDSRLGPAIGEEEVVADLFSTVLVPDNVQLPVGAGKGLINVILTFSEAQAKTLNPDVYAENILFDIFPNDALTGPVFVSTTVGKPTDLNESDEEFPVDDDLPIVTGSVEPELTVITQSIEVEKLVPILAASFVPGADGVTDDGVAFVAGQDKPPVAGGPPTGWVTQADGRAYPPIIPDPVCDPITGDGPDGTKLEDIPEVELTPLQKLLLSVKDRPLTFGAITKRRGFVIEPRPFLRGNESNIAFLLRLVPTIAVADSIPGRSDFKIIAAERVLTKGTAPPFSDKFATQVSNEIDVTIGAVKEGNLAGTIFAPGTLRRLFLESKALRDIIEKAERFEIKTETNTAEELQLARVIAPAASILFQLKNEGAGN